MMKRLRPTDRKGEVVIEAEPADISRRTLDEHIASERVDTKDLSKYLARAEGHLLRRNIPSELQDE